MRPLPSLNKLFSPFTLHRLGAAAFLLLGSLTGASAASFPDNTIPDSFSVQLKGNNSTPEDLDKVKEFGAKWVRKGFAWEGVEKTAGVYDFSGYDEFVKNCTPANHPVRPSIRDLLTPGRRSSIPT